jgi:hypothetical protein
VYLEQSEFLLKPYRRINVSKRIMIRNAFHTGFVLLALLAAHGSPALSAANPVGNASLTITAIAPRQTGAEPWIIYLDGMFDAAATARLAGLIAQERITRADVYFNSPGGSLLAAMSIGRLLRERGFDTYLGRRSVELRQPGAAVCYSACPFGFAGGVRRFLETESVFGVHAAANSVPVPDEFAFQQLVEVQATQYLNEMGVSPALQGLMRSVPHDGIRLLTLDAAVELRLVNASAARE